MDTLNKKSLRVTRGFTYTYYSSPAKPGRPTLLLCHGWPDEAALWSDLITSHLAPHGYVSLMLRSPVPIQYRLGLPFK